MDKIIKVLITDDEPYSREELKHLLSSYPFLKVIGEADSGENAVLQAIQLEPDVIFLDVEMPKVNGMEAAKLLKSLKKPPLLIFATAYPQFAAEAFRYEAVDYLLKPFDETQMAETVKRLYKQLCASENTEETKIKGKLAVDQDGELIYIDPADILYVFRDEKVSKIITKTHEFDSRIALKELESRLKPFQFFRIHKSYIVNLEHITKLTPWFNGAYQLEIHGKEEKLAVSRNYVKSLRAKLEI